MAQNPQVKWNLFSKLAPECDFHLWDRTHKNYSLIYFMFFFKFEMGGGTKPDGVGRQRERERQSEASSMLSTESDAGLDPSTLGS